MCSLGYFIIDFLTFVCVIHTIQNRNLTKQLKLRRLLFDQVMNLFLLIWYSHIFKVNSINFSWQFQSYFRNSWQYNIKLKKYNFSYSSSIYKCKYMIFKPLFIKVRIIFTSDPPYFFLQIFIIWSKEPLPMWQ